MDIHVFGNVTLSYNRTFDNLLKQDGEILTIVAIVNPVNVLPYVYPHYCKTEVISFLEEEKIVYDTNSHDSIETTLISFVAKHLKTKKYDRVFILVEDSFLREKSDDLLGVNWFYNYVKNIEMDTDHSVNVYI